MTAISVNEDCKTSTCVVASADSALDHLGNKVSSIRTPMLIQGRLQRTVTNLMHFKWEVTEQT